MYKKFLICPKCHSSLIQEPGVIFCEKCPVHFRMKDEIPIFTEKDEYWCNVAQTKMQELIRDAEISGRWLDAVYKHIPRYANALVPLYRADAQFLFPIDRNSRVLDAGSMWGGLTVPIAQFCKEIYALDKTWETLRLLQIRARQMKLDNVFPVVSSIRRLPFSDHFFDCIVLNGVLEWLGFEQDLVIEKHWSGKRVDSHTYTNNPESMQRAALRELNRVLKPGGSIYTAIENRIGLQYFFGHPDDHLNVRFVTFIRISDLCLYSKEVSSSFSGDGF